MGDEMRSGRGASTAGRSDVARSGRAARRVDSRIDERRRAECRADMQTEVVNLALDLLVREPDIEGFFGALAKDDGRRKREPHVRRLADRRSGQRSATCGWRMSRIGCSRRGRMIGRPRAARRQAIPVRKPRRSPVRVPAGMERDRRSTQRRSSTARSDSNVHLRHGIRHHRRDAARPRGPQPGVDDGLEPWRRRARDASGGASR